MAPRYLLLVTAMLAGCTDSAPSPFVAGFKPPPPPDGYTRYVAPAVHRLMPGEDVMLCQWIDVAADADVDVLDVTGYQTTTGHHAVLYSTSETNEPIGTSRECTTMDMVSVEFLGGFGGEGVSGTATKLPPGLVFRFRKGRALMANVHYLNATDEVQEVQSVFDVKTAVPSAQNRPVGMTGITVLDFSIPSNSASYAIDAYCNWPRESSLIMWSDHEHMDGVSIFTEVKHADGSVEPLAADPTWEYERAFNPRWEHWDLSSPRLLHAGDQVHINCAWKNPKGSPVMFPDEMCTGLGFYLESQEQVFCEGAAMAP